jgi:hypothetical protein
MRKEVTYYYAHDDLIERLNLPKDSMILEVYTSTVNCNPRIFCYKISVDEKILEKSIEKFIKKGERKKCKVEKHKIT